MSAAYIGTVERHSVGLQIVTAHCQPVSPGFMMSFKMQLGPLQNQDIGKQVYYDEVKRIYTMENNEQRDRREDRWKRSGFTREMRDHDLG